MNAGLQCRRGKPRLANSEGLRRLNLDLSHFAYLTTGLPGLATALVLGTAVGFIVGLVPGIGGRIGIILCIPFATFWEPIGGAVFLFAMHSVVHTASSIPAIAFALPSTGIGVSSTNPDSSSTGIR